uniref:Protein TBATA n=1 Tax=Trichobilharzia regenti TaxID=157069 RepID=A0AA85JZL1_TRIRE|nr:unnamed protein product [Trichobilharzia regenti]
MPNSHHEEINYLPDYSGRHNPHPQRVTHFTGFLGLPVPIVNDPGFSSHDRYTSPSRSITSNSLDLKRTNFPIGLSPSYYTDHLLNNSLKLTKRDHTNSIDSLSRSGRSIYTVHHVPVSILPLSRIRRRIPQLDTINGLKYFTGLQNYSARERPPLIGPLIDSDASRMKEVKQSQEFLNETKQMSFLNKHLSGRKLKWQNELGYLTGTILNQLKIPILDGNNYAQQSDRYSNTFNRSDYHYLQSDMNERIPYVTNNQTEILNRNQNSSGELLYSSKTGRLLPPSNSSRCNRTRSHASIYDRNQCSNKTSSMNDLFRDYEIQVFSMICSILQTNDLNAVQHWLENATDREKNLIISLVSTALSHQDAYFNGKQNHANCQQPESDTHWSRREKNLNMNTEIEEKNVKSCSTTTDRLVIDDVHNINETHSRGIQANLLDATSNQTVNSDDTDMKTSINNTNVSSSLCQTPLKSCWRQNESIGVP